MCHIVPTNLASQSTYAKIGFKRAGFIWYLRLFGFKMFNFPPGRFMKKFSQSPQDINTNNKIEQSAIGTELVVQG